MGTRSNKFLRTILFAVATTVLSSTATAQLFCVFDPLGTQGDYYAMAKDYQLAAKRWSVTIDLSVYTDDDKLDEAFKAGKCDMASMIGMRARQYNIFTGTLDAPGMLDNYAEVRDALGLMAAPKLARNMSQGNYEVVGVLPVGAAYAVVNDRHINSLGAAAGHKTPIFAWDQSQKLMAEDMHVIPVPTSLTNSATLFNKGDVDFIVAPAVLYKPMELSRGVGANGGIIRRPLFQFSMQFVSVQSKFPPTFGQQSREYFAQQVNHGLGIIHNGEAALDQRLWIYALRSEAATWDTAMRSIVAHMVKSEIFDKRMIGLLKRVRCKNNVDEPECAPTVQQQQLQ
jgi:hypothetical protein